MGNLGQPVARFDNAIATAIRLIQRNGMQCAWNKEVLTPIDPLQPWLGNTSVITVFSPFICFVPASGSFYGLIRLLGGTESPSVKTFGLMAPQEFEPVLTDLVTRDGEPLKIATLDVLRPNEQVVLYTLGLEG